MKLLHTADKKVHFSTRHKVGDPVHHFLFTTHLGSAGLAFSAHGLTCCVLPSASEDASLEGLRAKVGATTGAVAPPAWVAETASRIARVLQGERDSLLDVPLDLSSLSEATRRIYRVAREIPAGTTLSYGEVATRAGLPGGARSVGRAMATNPFPPVVPCHRVVSKSGELCGFSAPGGLDTKATMLAREGARLPDSRHSLLVPGLFDASFDGTAVVRRLARKDGALGAHMRRVGPFVLPAPESTDPYASLAHAIVYQQLSGRAAATIWNRFLGLFGGAMPEPVQLSRAPTELLRQAGLSASKAVALLDLATHALAGTVPPLDALLYTPDDAIVRRLSLVRGIGPWSVEMFLLFSMGRPDVMPVTDYGVRKGYQAVFSTRDLPTPEALRDHSLRWAPYRSVATWYLWRALD